MEFDVYFHTKRKTDKMRKEMQSEINLIKKEEHKEKMKDKFQEALRAKLEIMQQKEIAKIE